MKKKIFFAMLALLLLSGCMNAKDHQEAVSNPDTDRISAGTVQRQISTGMSSAAVIEVLGSPNIVTTDEQRREVWVYDKISTEHVYSRSTSSGNILVLAGGIIGGVAGVGGGGGLGGDMSSGASSTRQRTLTIIIKFDEQGRVRDFAYRQSSF